MCLRDSALLVRSIFCGFFTPWSDFKRVSIIHTPIIHHPLKDDPQEREGTLFSKVLISPSSTAWDIEQINLRNCPYSLKKNNI